MSEKYKQPLCTIWVGKTAEIPGQHHTNRPAEFITCCQGSVKDSDYDNSGFSRGHLVADSDMKNFNCGTHDCSYGTYSLCNISPQNQELNGNKWNFIEKGTSKCAKLSSVIVYSGHIFHTDLYLCTKKNMCLGKNEIDVDKTKVDCKNFLTSKDDWYKISSHYSMCRNESDIPVPDAFYKIIVLNDGSYRTYAIIMEQQNYFNGLQNGLVSSTGQDAINKISTFLRDNGINLPLSLFVIQNEYARINEWKKGECPFDDIP